MDNTISVAILRNKSVMYSNSTKILIGRKSHNGGQALHCTLVFSFRILSFAAHVLNIIIIYLLLMAVRDPIITNLTLK